MGRLRRAPLAGVALTPATGTLTALGAIRFSYDAIGGWLTAQTTSTDGIATTREPPHTPTAPDAALASLDTLLIVTSRPDLARALTRHPAVRIDRRLAPDRGMTSGLEDTYDLDGDRRADLLIAIAIAIDCSFQIRAEISLAVAGAWRTVGAVDLVDDRDCGA